MNRHKWSDIKARTTPEVHVRIEAEARLLSQDIPAGTAAGSPTPQAREDDGSVSNAPDKRPDRT